MKPLHLVLDENAEALQWANAQANKIGARGHVGTHLDCYTSIPEHFVYEIQAYILDCQTHMPQEDELQAITSLKNKALILHTGNLEHNSYGTEAYFGKDTSLTEESLRYILNQEPLFIIIDSHGIAEKGVKHITFDKLCEAHKCHVIENADLTSIRNVRNIKLKIIVDKDHPSTGKPCKLYQL